MLMPTIQATTTKMITMTIIQEMEVMETMGTIICMVAIMLIMGKIYNLIWVGEQAMISKP